MLPKIVGDYFRVKIRQKWVVIPFFRCSKILGEADKQEILQKMFRKFQISNRLPEQIFSENCRWVPLLKPILAPSQIFSQAFFIIWGSLLSASFIYSGLKLIHRDGNVQKQLEDIEIGQSTSRTDGRRGEREPRKLQKFRLQQVFWVFVVVDMFGVYSFYSKVKTPSPWPWWFFHTLRFSINWLNSVWLVQQPTA